MTNIDRAANDFEDPVAAREKLMEGVQKFDADNKTPVQVMGEAVSFARESGLATKQPRQAAKTGEADSEIMGGFSEYADGVPAKFVPYSRAKGRLTVQQEAQNNAYRVAGGGQAGVDAAFAVAQGQVERGAPQVKAVSDYRKQVAEVGVASDLINRSRELLNSNVKTGLAAVIVQTAAGSIDQAKQMLGNSTVRVNDENKQTGKFDVRDLGSSLEVDAEFEKLLSKVPGIEGGLRGLANQSANAQAFKTNMILLTYSVAKAMDPAGRLSDRDVAAVARALGQGMLGARQDQIAALNEIENSLRSRINRAYGANEAALRKAGVNPFEFKAAPAQAAPAPTRLKFNLTTGDFE